MDKYALVVFSMVAVVTGLVVKEGKAPDGWITRVDDMEFCLNQENVTEDEMREFIVEKKNQDENEPLKNAIYCFLKRINFFDGVTWNVEVITESESKNPNLLKMINDCLEKDDFTLSAPERAYQAQKCVIENGAIEP